MKKNESARDRAMEALLREDAKGGADEALLSDLEERIDAEGESAERRTARRGGSGRWVISASAAAGVAIAAGYLAWEDGFSGAAREAAGSAAPRAIMTTPSESADLERVRRATEAVASSLESKPQPSVEDVSHFSLGQPTNLAGDVANAPSPLIARRETDAAIAYDGSVALSEMRTRLNPIPNEWGGPPPAGGVHPALPVDRERYGQLEDQPWKTPWQDPLSTFSVDVDTASYANIRRMLRSGAQIPKDAVRIEECINYFDYSYPAPENGGPFAVHVDMATCPWQAKHHLVKIGLKGKEVDTNTRPASNLVFLIDVSGSMNQPNKLPLLVESMKVLVEELDERDSVGIVVYAGSAGTILEPTKVVGDGRTEILSALDNLRAGGSTAGAAGLRGAYELAARNFVKDGVNRVILATDGDFNVGVSSNGALVDLVKERAKSGVYLSVLGFGNGNLNDSMLEAITNDGNGNYYYIDTEREGRKVFLQNLSGTLVTIAKDVKIQVEFNPSKVAAYRLIGYANRILPPEAFNDDTVDAGDIGAGHTVTALYEVVPTGVEPPAIGGVDELEFQKPANRQAVDSPKWMTVKLRYKAPDGDVSTKMEMPVENDPVAWRQAPADFQFAAGVALFGEKLRESDKINDAPWNLVAELARKGSAQDPHGHRAEFLELVSLAGKLPVTVPAAGQGAVEARDVAGGAIGQEKLEALEGQAEAHRQAGHQEEALLLQKELLALSSALLGQEHSKTIVAMETLAGDYKAAGREAEALSLLERVLELTRKTRGR